MGHHPPLNRKMNNTITGMHVAMSLKENYFFLFFLGGNIDDCLFLNVFVPASVKPNDKMAVMVWIHGGAFAYGTASHYPAGVLATFNDVIVVSINYRLGILGFFNIPDTDYKGNYGMLDQVSYLCTWHCLCTLLTC